MAAMGLVAGTQIGPYEIVGLLSTGGMGDSDAHGESTGHMFSLIASARLHRLDPEAYLRDLFRVLTNWPRDR